MFKLLKYLKSKDYLIFALVILFVVLQIVVELKVPELFSNLINLITEQSVGTINHSQILQVGINMSLLILATLVLYFVVGFLMAKFSASISKTLRFEFFKKVVNLGRAELKNFSVSSLITRTTNDISQIQQFFSMGFRILLTAPITAILAILKIFQNNSVLTFGTIGAVLILITLISIIFMVAIPKFKKVQKLTDQLNLMSRESLLGIRVIRAYNRERYHEQRFEKVNDQLSGLNTFIDRLMSLLNPIITFVISLLVLFIYWFGAYLVGQNILNVGEVLAFAQYAIMVLFSFTALTFVFIMMPRSSVSAKRLNEVFYTKSKVEFPKNDEQIDLSEVNIEFKNVSFKYPNAKDYVLKDINLKVANGETVAFIGSTGSGKSTLINLIVRFYDCVEGEILINGKNIKEFSEKTLLSLFGYVPQKGLLFGGSIASNLKFGNENATEQDMKDACGIAEASRFIARFEDGFSHFVSQGGTNLSGGQRQRLSIARAIIKNPKIFIFDDSFSALDYKTDKRLRKSLEKQFPSTTKLFVAQRVGTIIGANKIIVLEKGKMVGMGSHEQLLKSCKIYREIAQSQLGKEALK